MNMVLYLLSKKLSNSVYFLTERSPKPITSKVNTKKCNNRLLTLRTPQI